MLDQPIMLYLRNVIMSFQPVMLYLRDTVLVLRLVITQFQLAMLYVQISFIYNILYCYMTGESPVS